MASFFIRRPIVAMVISIITTILGVTAMLSLPIAQFPDIVPPEIMVQATYVGADAITLEESVATPIEQKISGVDDMIYMYSTNANNGQMTLRVDFEVGSDPNTDLILVQMRYSQAESQLPQDVRNYGVTVQKSTSSPLALFSLYSPSESRDALFLANYAYIHINDPMTRVPGVGQVQIFGAGQYAMRLWVDPDLLAQRGITVPDIVNAIQAQNTVNPAGQIGGEPVPPGQPFTYTVRAQGRLESVEDFENVIVRANVDGSVLLVKDVARVQLGAQTYQLNGRLNGKPAAIIAIYQSPGSNAIQTMDEATALMERMKAKFPGDLAYDVSLDTTLAVREGMAEILQTLVEALALVLFVVFVFLQGFRSTLIPLLAVPVSLVGTFIVFPMLGFSINTLSLFGLVLAIGIVVDDAIVVVEAVEHHIEQGLSPRDAALRAMEQVTGPVIATALILGAVFVPTAFLPGITGSLYQQFAVTIAVSVFLSAFNALTLSPALSALLLRPKTETRGPLGVFFAAFNRVFGRLTDGYVRVCAVLTRRSALALTVLLAVPLLAGLMASRLPAGFLPEEDQGYLYLNVQLPLAASLQRTDEACKEIEAILSQTEGVASYNTIVGFSLLSQVQTTYNAFFFVTLSSWSERDPLGRTADVIQAELNARLAELPSAEGFVFPPPAIPGVGSSGGITFMLEDRGGHDIAFLAENTKRFLAAANARPEIGRAMSTLIPNAPQIFADVDEQRALKMGVPLGSIYQTLQTFLGGYFINYFNRFGRVWQVYVEAEGKYRNDVDKLGRFYVNNSEGSPVPMSALVDTKTVYGPEFTLRYDEYRAAQILAGPAPGFTANQVMTALEEVFASEMPLDMGYDYMGMSFQAQAASEGISPAVVFAFSLLMVFLILAAQYESWSLPLSVLLGVPIAVLGAFVLLFLREFELDVYAQIGLVMLIGLSAKNAILIVEFAREEKAAGKSIVDAALAAARLRLRPILMTAFAFILGVLPLVTASGSGAESRQILGTAVIGGMIAASGIAIFLIPASFALVERFLVGDESTSQNPAPRNPEEADTAGDS